MSRLINKYRPNDWASVIGQPKAVTAIRRLLERPGFDGDAIWVNGYTGAGKSTIADIIASAASDLHRWKVKGRECDAGMVKRIVEDMHYSAIDGGWKVYVVNEAQAMTQGAVDMWLDVLDELPPKRIVVFTSAERDDADLFGQFTKQLLNRCKVFSLTNQGVAALGAPWAKAIAEREGLDGQPIEKYVRLYQECKNSHREVLQRIENGDMVAA